MSKSPLALTDEQMSAVLRAAEPLEPRDRASFLRDVALALAALAEPGDGSVALVCRAVQARYFDPPDFACGTGSSRSRAY
jgi:gluconate kinase